MPQKIKWMIWLKYSLKIVRISSRLTKSNHWRISMLDVSKFSNNDLRYAEEFYYEKGKYIFIHNYNYVNPDRRDSKFAGVVRMLDTVLNEINIRKDNCEFD